MASEGEYMSTTIVTYDMQARKALSVDEMEDEVAIDRFRELQKKFQDRQGEVELKFFAGLGKEEVIRTFPWYA